jgi:hypothetical protein
MFEDQPAGLQIHEKEVSCSYSKLYASQSAQLGHGGLPRPAAIQRLRNRKGLCSRIGLPGEKGPATLRV